MIFVCPHSSRERERERQKEKRLTFFVRLKSSSSSLCFFFFCHFFLVVVAEKKKEKKRKKIVGSIRNDRSASLPEEHFFRKKVESTGPFFGLFWSFRKGLFDFSKKRAPLEKDIAHARRER